MKTTLHLTIYSLCSIFFACSKTTEPPCTAFPCNFYEDGKYLGSISLNDSNDYWLAAYNTGTIANESFYNEVGTALSYSIHYHQVSEKEYLNSYEKADNSCCPRTTFRDYLNIEEETLEYLPNQNGISFRFKRSIKPSVSLIGTDSARIDSTSELFELTIQNKTLRIYLDTSYKSDHQIFYKQKTLHQKTFTNVFEFIDPQADTSKIIPQGYFFTFENGLIGYYLTNKELWAKH